MEPLRFLGCALVLDHLSGYRRIQNAYAYVILRFLEDRLRRE